MHYEIKGKEYPVFDNDWTLKEAFELMEKASLTVANFRDALVMQNPYAVTALIYFTKRRAGELVKWDEVVANYKFSDFQVIQDDDAGSGDAEEETEAETDPTGKPSKPAGRTRKSAT